MLIQRVDKDLVIQYSENDKVTIKGAYSYSAGYSFIENIEFADGTVAIIDMDTASLLITYPNEILFESSAMHLAKVAEDIEVDRNENADLSTDWSAAILVQELSSSTIDNNVFNSNEKTTTEVANLFTEQYVVE